MRSAAVHSAGRSRRNRRRPSRATSRSSTVDVTSARQDGKPCRASRPTTSKRSSTARCSGQGALVPAGARATLDASATSMEKSAGLISARRRRSRSPDGNRDDAAPSTESRVFVMLADDPSFAPNAEIAVEAAKRFVRGLPCVRHCPASPRRAAGRRRIQRRTGRRSRRRLAKVVGGFRGSAIDFAGDVDVEHDQRQESHRQPGRTARWASRKRCSSMTAIPACC